MVKIEKFIIFNLSESINSGFFGNILLMALTRQKKYCYFTSQTLGWDPWIEGVRLSDHIFEFWLSGILIR
jgi:hypothetical protein